MARHISNHSSKSRLHQRHTFETKLCQRHYLSHNYVKSHSKSQIYEKFLLWRHAHCSLLMSKTLSKPQLYLIVTILGRTHTFKTK